MPVTPEELVATLMRRKRDERDAYARRAEELRGRVTAWARRSVGEGLFTRAWLIGSLAWGELGVGSDVDVVVEGLDSAREGRTWAELLKELEVEVDLLRLEELPVGFRRRVLEQGVVLT